jgi:nucleoporin NUP42
MPLLTVSKQGEESALNEKMQQQVKAIMNDIDGAIRYVEEGANVHPNRIDIAKGIAPLTSTTPPGGNPTSNSNSSLTQTPAPAPTSTFGQPSRPAFGQTAFGQPSNPGQAAPGFGAPSGLGAKPSPFSTPTLGGNQAFGKPAFGAPGFGTPSLPGAGGGFGQANALGQKPAFGQASAPGTAAPMSQPNALGQASPFGNSAFGQSGFGNPSPLGGGGTPFSTAAASNPSPFGQQPAAQKPPFGQSQTGTFGQGQNQGSTAGASPFASAAKPAQGAPSVFGQPTPPASNASPFATQPASKVSPFGTQPTQTTNPSPFAPRPQQTTSTPSPFGMQQAPVQPVTQMVPQQFTAPASNIDAKERFKEGKPAEYEGEQGSILEEIYTRVGRLGRFNDNELIPDTPPKCEWIAAIPML